MNINNSFKAFAQIKMLTNGGPANSTRTLSVYIYQEASNLNMGFASAMALLLMLCLLLVAIPYLKMTFSSKEG